MQDENEPWPVELPELIRMNQLVRGRIDFLAFDRWYDMLLPAQRRQLADMLYVLSTQAGRTDTVFEEACAAAQLDPEQPVVNRFLTALSERSYFDPQRFLMELDESALRVAFRLFVALFGIAEGRVCRKEAPEHCNHWWHRDLLDRRVVADLLNDPHYYRTSMRDDDRLKPRMSEHDWLSANDADRMLAFICGRTTPGKYRLAYSTIFRMHWATDSDDIGRRCQRFVERHAGGLLPETKRAALHREALTIAAPTWRDCVLALVVPDGDLEAAVTRAMRQLVGRRGWPTDGYLMRELFGNPFRPIALEPKWLTADVVALAEGIRRDHTFDGMPVLADALQEAGCDCAPLLDHLRDGCLFTVAEDVWRAGSHLPGCWALDLILSASANVTEPQAESGDE